MKTGPLALLVLFVNFSLLDWSECCAQSTNSADVIKIGAVQSLTGIAGEDGKTVVQALQLAADQINSKGQHKIELLIEDDGTQPQNSVTALQRLTQRGVDAVVGATWDFTTNPLLVAAGRSKTVIFNTSTLMESLALSQANGYAFVNSVTATDEASVFNSYLASRQVKKMAVVFANNSWGETQLNIYKRIAEKFGVYILDELRSASYDANEWNTFITRIKQRHADVVLLLLNKKDLEAFLRRASEQGLKTSFFASKNLFDALRNSSSRSLFNGVCFTYPMEQLEREAEFRARYKSKFGEDARIYADNTYDALFIVVKGVEAARRRNLPLSSVLREVEYEGIVGRYKFEEGKSFCSGSSSLVCVRDGKVELEK